MVQQTEIYTVGHSNHPMERFIELLQLHSIECIVDVRRWPVSKFCPHYSKGELEKCLKASGIEYIFSGKELGGRRESGTGAGSSTMDTEKIRKSSEYQQGLEELIKTGRRHRTAIICGEGDPRRCHRHYLISQDLLDSGIRVMHILPDGIALPALRERIDFQLPLFGPGS